MLIRFFPGRTNGNCLHPLPSGPETRSPCQNQQILKEKQAPSDDDHPTQFSSKSHGTFSQSFVKVISIVTVDSICLGFERPDQDPVLSVYDDPWFSFIGGLVMGLDERKSSPSKVERVVPDPL